VANVTIRSTAATKDAAVASFLNDKQQDPTTASKQLRPRLARTRSAFLWFLDFQTLEAY
jgi:hypothetical protein